MHVLVGFLIARIYFASLAAGKLLTNRHVARQMPWRYVRTRLTRDWVLVLRMLGIVAIVVLWPLGVTLDDPARKVVAMSGVGTWAVSLLVPWIHYQVRDRAQRHGAR